MVDRHVWARRGWARGGIAPALLVCSVGSVVVQACTRVSDVDRFPVRDEELRIVETVPAQGADDVQTDARIDVCMSALVDPRSIAPVDAFLTSGEVPIDVELSLELLPWTGPGGVALAADPGAPWCEGSVLAIAPEIELEPELAYRVRIVPRMRGWDGEALDTEQEGWVSEGGARRFYLEFRVAEAAGTSSSGASESGASESGASESGASESGASESGASESGSDSESTGGEPPPSGPTLTDLFADGGPFDPARALCSCHRDADDLAFMRLDLTDVEMAYAGLVLDARERDTGFPMVSPRLPSESFLVHKLLKQHGEPLLGVLGDAMPKDGELPYADYVAIALWIEAGALP